MARTIVPVADLRRYPKTFFPQGYEHHELRESQLLYNEEVHVLETQGEWIKVAALEQMRFTPNRGWHPYEGWVHHNEISLEKPTYTHVISSFSNSYSYGTYLDAQAQGTRLIPQKLNRKQLIREAMQFLDVPYLWGGRSSPLPGLITSVDCSGLINLLYRAQGIFIPRDAHDQFLFGEPTATFLPGDPLYLSKGQRFNHVILKVQEDLFLEAPESGKRVRLLKQEKDIWEHHAFWSFHDRNEVYRGIPIRIATSAAPLFNFRIN